MTDLRHVRIKTLHATNHELLTIASHAQCDADRSVDCLTPIPAHMLPDVSSSALSAHHDAHVIWSSWHHGGEYAAYAVGDEDLLHHCSLTDNERERLTLDIRRADVYGENVYVVAQCTAQSPLAELPSSRLKCAGLLFVRRDY